MIWRCLTLCSVLLFPALAWAQYEELTILEIYRLGVEAYEADDAEGFLAPMEELNRRRPFQYAVQYNYTIALAKAGQIEAGILQLELMADLGFSIDLAADEDFAPLYDHPRYHFLSSRLSLNNEPEGHSAIVYEIDHTDVMPEGIAVHEGTGDTYISTVRSGQVFRQPASGELTLFAGGNRRWHQSHGR